MNVDNRINELMDLGLTEGEAELMVTPIREILAQDLLQHLTKASDKKVKLVREANEKWLKDNPAKDKRIFIHGTTSKVR